MPLLGHGISFQPKTFYNPTNSQNDISWIGWDQAPNWSLPVRPKISAVLAVAIIASGLFAPPPSPSLFDFSWQQPWSTPANAKPALNAALQQSFTTSPFTELVSEIVTYDK